jgi:hypothetical protein
MMKVSPLGFGIKVRYTDLNGKSQQVEKDNINLTTVYDKDNDYKPVKVEIKKHFMTHGRVDVPIGEAKPNHVVITKMDNGDYLGIFGDKEGSIKNHDWKRPNFVIKNVNTSKEPKVSLLGGPKILLNNAGMVRVENAKDAIIQQGGSGSLNINGLMQNVRVARLVLPE